MVTWQPLIFVKHGRALTLDFQNDVERRALGLDSLSNEIPTTYTPQNHDCAEAHQIGSQLCIG